jgi:hypothetical protein
MLSEAKHLDLFLPINPEKVRDSSLRSE